MSIYKSINPSDISFRTEEVYHSHTITSSKLVSDGVEVKNQFQSHSGYFNHPITQTSTQITQSNNYFFLKANFYQTGSNRLNSPVNSQENIYRHPTFRHKFHGEKVGVFTHIPQLYLGDGVRRTTFKLTDNTQENKNIIIKDDGYGNLYSTNARISQSANNASSSENYVGNIFYREGIVALTTTGSWSGSVKYNEALQSFTMNFESVKNIYTRTYTLKLNANEFNMTNNPTIKKSDPSITSAVTSTDYGPQPPFKLSNSSLLNDNISGSTDWRPYINSIGLYDENNDLIITARLSQPIEKRDDVNLVFDVSIDF
tara:strand:+ start:25114 stop:26055 length:942 start_codon:yes stop_codon:yes gene_type:complete